MNPSRSQTSQSEGLPKRMTSQVTYSGYNSHALFQGHIKHLHLPQFQRSVARSCWLHDQKGFTAIPVKVQVMLPYCSLLPLLTLSSSSISYSFERKCPEKCFCRIQIRYPPHSHHGGIGRTELRWYNKLQGGGRS